jgi:hypothetical protein
VIIFMIVCVIITVVMVYRSFVAKDVWAMSGNIVTVAVEIVLNVVLIFFISRFVTKRH